MNKNLPSLLTLAAAARPSIVSIITLATFLLPIALHGDEGMWLFNKPPSKQLERDHGFQLQPDWLDHADPRWRGQ